MKTVCLLLIAFFFLLTATHAQEHFKNKFPKEASIDLGAFRTPILSKDFYGFNYQLKFLPGNRLGTGLYLAGTQKKLTDTFTYSISKPKLEYYEFGWINQYNFLQLKKLRLCFNVINGISIARLGDAAIKVKRRTRYGYTYVAREIATNYDYLLEPGTDLSFKLFSFHHSPDMWLTTSAGYRFLFGHNKYGTPGQFSDYVLSMGISLIGYTKDN